MRTGTQSIQRTVAILKAVAERKDIGWRMTDLAEYCGLGKTTTHRILRRLAAERLVRQRPGDRRYMPGPLMFELAASLPAHMALRDALHPELAAIARAASGVAFFFLRADLETVCIDRVGSAGVQPLMVIGTRRPLTESTAGLAILLAMKAPARSQALAAIRRRMLPRKPNAAERRRAETYRKLWPLCQRAGYAYSMGAVVPGLGAIAVPLADAAGRPIGALGVMGPEALFSGDRLPRAVAELRKDALRLERSNRKLIAEISAEPERD
jgi:DNA-binding IclR family transcriptional regulator